MNERSISSNERVSDKRLAELADWYAQSDNQHNGWWIAVAWCLKELQERRRAVETEPDSENVSVGFDNRRRPDEIHMREGSIHLERLTRNRFSLILQTPQSRSQFSLHSAQRIDLEVVEVNMQPNNAEKATVDPRNCPQCGPHPNESSDEHTQRRHTFSGLFGESEENGRP